MRSLVLLIIVTSTLFSCKNKEKIYEDKDSKDSVVVVNKRNINSIGYVLTPETSEIIKDWTQYQQFDVYLTRYFAISNSDALLNANILSGLATMMKDSIPEVFSKDLSTVSRFNILDTECKRLSDMSSITAIKQEEVSSQIKKILEAYSGINAKLNASVAVQKMEDEIKLDPDFVRILSQNPDAALEEEIQKNSKQPLEIKDPKTLEKKRKSPKLLKAALKGHDTH